MARKPPAGRLERVTVVGREGVTLKVVQADRSATHFRVRRVAVRDVPEGAESKAAGETLKSVTATLDQPLGRCLLVVPRSEVLVRYTTLPTKSADELRTLAIYQMHGELPFPVEECELALQPLGTDDSGTHVCLVAVHRPVVDGMVTLARSAGLVPDGVAVSTEGAARWAMRLWGHLGAPAPAQWLFAAVAGRTVEVGIMVDGRPMFTRRGELPDSTPEALVQLIQETVSSYMRELTATPPTAVLVMGAFQDPAAWETTIAARLERPVHVVDPASARLWEAPVVAEALALLPSVEMVDLLGVASAPQPLVLDLLPVALKAERVAAQARRVWQATAVWAGVGVGCLALASAVAVGRQWLAVRDLRQQVAASEAPVKVVQAHVARLETALAVRRQTAAMLGAVTAAAAGMPPGVLWNAATVDADGRFQIKGVAADYPQLFEVVRALSGVPGGRDARVQSATERTPGRVEFDVAVTVAQP